MNKLFDVCYPYCKEVQERDGYYICLKHKIKVSDNSESCDSGELCIFALERLNIYKPERVNVGGIRESEFFE